MFEDMPGMFSGQMGEKKGLDGYNLPQQCLYLRPLPHGQGAFRGTFPQVDGSFGSSSWRAVLKRRFRPPLTSLVE